MRTLHCFKSYDIRGELGLTLTEEIAYDIGAAFVKVMAAKTVVVGGDCRESSASLKAALARGLTDMGCDVIDIGMCGTEEIYFATDHLGVDGGIEVTASHNPINYNGMKMVMAGARPLHPEQEMAALKTAAEAADFAIAAHPGTVRSMDIRPAYAAKVCSFVDPAKIKPLKILVNAGNGAAGPAFDEIAAQLDETGAPLTFVHMDHEPDGTFPNGIPNPLLPENQPRTAQAVRDTGADFGVAWDGDFDRCFFFDHQGNFIDGYYIVGLLAQQALMANPGATIIHDARMTWNTREIVEDMGGTPIQTRTGHSFMKTAMREHDAIYGGEMSAHHYFRDFMFCDSGMIPWLMVAELVSVTGQSLAGLVRDRMARFPASGEVNFTVDDPAMTMSDIEDRFRGEAVSVTHPDGLTMDMGDWRFNLRASGTEPLLRLNIESRGDPIRVQTELERITGLIHT